jgi:hypothetical protein
MTLHRMYQNMTGEVEEAKEALRVSTLVKGALEALPGSQLLLSDVAFLTGLSKAEIQGALDDETLVHALGVASIEYSPETGIITIGPEE